MPPGRLLHLLHRPPVGAAGQIKVTSTCSAFRAHGSLAQTAPRLPSTAVPRAQSCFRVVCSHLKLVHLTPGAGARTCYTNARGGSHRCQLSVSSASRRAATRGIQEHFNETHRKQAAREERLGKQPCLLLTSPICPLHLEQHEGQKHCADSSDPTLPYNTEWNHSNLKGRFNPALISSIFEHLCVYKSGKGSLWLTVVSFFIQ